MKSLSFSKVALQKEDVLSKNEMKKIVGGYWCDPGMCPQECFPEQMCNDQHFCYVYQLGFIGCDCSICP